MNLADTSVSNKFVNMLTHCEAAGMALAEWETNFVRDMREKFDCREEQLDMGMTRWNPSVNQWNTLHGIWSKV